MLDAAIECDDCLIAVLMNCIECKKQKNYGVPAVECQLRFTFYFSKTKSPKFSA
jgi:hypothetical protein